MRISHTELEGCRKTPKEWCDDKKSKGRGIILPGYDGLLRRGLFFYHKTLDMAAARDHLLRLYKNNEKRLTNADRVHNSIDTFASYVKWIEQSGTIAIGYPVRIELPCESSLVLAGEVHRVDILDHGYRAVLLGDFPGWESQLRFPLIQRAIALVYGRPENEILVGVQHLDGTNLQTVHFGKMQLDDSICEFGRLGFRLEQIMSEET